MSTVAMPKILTLDWQSTTVISTLPLILLSGLDGTSFWEFPYPFLSESQKNYWNLRTTLSKTIQSWCTLQLTCGSSSNQTIRTTVMKWSRWVHLYVLMDVKDVTMFSTYSLRWSTSLICMLPQRAKASCKLLRLTMEGFLVAVSKMVSVMPLIQCPS